MELEHERETTRQRLTRWLEQEYDFEVLREGLQLSARELEAELRHVARSVKQRGQRLIVVEPRCESCGFAFPGRSRKHYQSPSRCPECRGRHVAPARFRIG